MPQPIPERTSPQGPPVTFRPGAEFEQVVGAFGVRHNLPLNQAFKVLAALAISGMDYRYYELMAQMAAAMEGTNAFFRACLNVNTALLGAVRLLGDTPLDETARSRFIRDTVRDFLDARGPSGRTFALPPIPTIPAPSAVSSTPGAPALEEASRRPDARELRPEGLQTPEVEEKSKPAAFSETTMPVRRKVKRLDQEEERARKRRALAEPDEGIQRRAGPPEMEDRPHAIQEVEAETSRMGSSGPEPEKQKVRERD